MAKIEMDISEYEAMKENKTLLENSLKKERELQEQIKKLTDEKTKALEDAKMKVVKVTKSQVTEHCLTKRDTEQIWSRIFKTLNIDVDDRYLSRHSGLFTIVGLRDIFFETTKSYSEPYTEITTHGLDEIKSEISADLKAKMDDEIKLKLENAQVALSKNDELLKENNNLKNVNDTLTNENQKLIKELYKLKNEVTDYFETNEKFKEVKELLKDGYGFWNKRELLDKIISTIN